MDILKTIILGIIEGITEWLPISSTGHLIIAEEFLNLNVFADPDRQRQFHGNVPCGYSTWRNSGRGDALFS